MQLGKGDFMSQKMQRSFSPRSKVLQKILAKGLHALLCHHEDDVLVVHHVHDSYSKLQVEFEIRHHTGKISFGRKIFAG